MKFTLSWLRTHLATEADVQAIGDRLTAIGLELESITDRAAELAPFVVGFVVEVKQHPNADRLRVCKVDTGSAVVQVVCGAPNARTGMKGVFAPVGSFIPGTKLKLEADRGQALADGSCIQIGVEMRLEPAQGELHRDNPWPSVGTSSGRKP